MKKHFTGMIVFFLCAAIPLLDAQINTGNRGLDTMLTDMDALLKTVKANKEPRIPELFNFVVTKIKAKEVAVETRKGGSFWESIVFKTSGKPTLSIDEQMFENHKNGFSLSMSLALYQFNRIYIYFANRENFNEIMKIKMLQNIFDLDSYYLIGMFVAEYVGGSKYQITDFEDFIARQIGQGNFDSVAGVLLLQNPAVMNAMYSLATGDLPPADVDHAMEELFTDKCEAALVRLLDSKTEDVVKFFDLVLLRSYFIDGLDLVYYVTGARYDVNTITNLGWKAGRCIQTAGVIVQLNAEFINSYSASLRKKIGLP